MTQLNRKRLSRSPLAYVVLNYMYYTTSMKNLYLPDKSFTESLSERRSVFDSLRALQM